MNKGGIPWQVHFSAIIGHLLYFVALPVALFVAWWYVSTGSTSMVYPPLQDIVAAFSPTWLSGKLRSDALPSLLRLVAGYGFALAIGIGLGTVIGLRPRLRVFLEPTLEFFRAIPPPVLVPALLLILGIGTSMKIFVIALGSLWPVLLNTIEGVRSLEEVLRDTARTYRFRRRTILTTLILRGASPQIMAGARQGLSYAIILMVISEMFAANNGIGYMIIQFQRSFAIVEMWTGIILLGVIGISLSIIFRLIERRVLFWYIGLRQMQRGGH